MQEQIKEIAEKAGFEVVPDSNIFKLEQFAKLIALQCISIIKSQQSDAEYMDDWDYGYDAALDKTENDVSKYFGVG